MHRFNARQASTTFADEPTTTLTSKNQTHYASESVIHGGNSSTTVECLDNVSAQQTISLISGPDGIQKLRTVTVKHGNSSGHGGQEVTKGCRSCIDNSSKEQKCEYFLKQKCPLCVAWVKIAGDAPSTMATFEEHAANSLRSSNPITNFQSMLSRGSLTENGDRRDNTLSRPTRAVSTASRARNAMWREDVYGARSDVDSNEKGQIGAGAEGDEECVMPPPRFGHTAVLYKGCQIIIFGGKANNEHYYNDVYAYEVERRRWAMLQAEYTEEVAAAGAPAIATTTRGTEASTSVSSPSPSRFSPESWGHSAVQEQHSYDHQQNCSHRGPSGEGSVQGGGNTEVSAPCTTVLTTDHASRPHGRVGHAAALYRGTMYILSGERQGKYFDDMWALDIPSLTWSKECGLPFSPRKGHTMHLLPAECTATRAREDMLVVFGGLVKASRLHPRPADPELPARNAGELDMMCAPTSETLLYYPVQRRWCHLKTCGDTPTPRFYHVSQLVTGTSLLLLFGGRTVSPAPASATMAAGDGSFMNDLRILDVSTGMWREIRDATGDVPSPRMCAASVFVNGNFAVFAGGGDGYCQNAYEYQLGANRWRRLTPNDQPACSRPTVIYAKDRLVFFGGFAPRIGVMNCTMELCLAPLSLTNQCLLWWNRCAFEKHVRTCTQNRMLEEAKVAAMAAMARCRKANGCCGKQITLSRNLANPGCSPLPTPRQLTVDRATRRPVPFPSRFYDNTTSWNAWPASQGGGGACDVPHGSLSPSYAPSSPEKCSPLSGASQSTPSWQDAANANSNAGNGGLYCASSVFDSLSYHGSPAAAAAVPGTAAAATMRPSSVFPSRPNIATLSHVGSQPSTMSHTASVTPPSYASPRSLTTGGQVQSGGPQDSRCWNATHHISSVNTSIMAPAGGVQQSMMAVRTWTDSVQRNSAPSRASGASSIFSNSVSAATRISMAAPVESTHNSNPLTSVRASPREPAESGCCIVNCIRRINGFAATSPLRFYTSQRPPAVRRTGSSGGGGGPVLAGDYSPPPMNSHPSPRPLRINTNAQSPPSPQAAEMSDCPSSPLTVYCTAVTASCALLSPLAQQRHSSAHLTRSASSRGSSMRSVHSASSEEVPLSHVKLLMQRLEGPHGPFLLRAMAAEVQKQGCD
ncbi:putative Kelch-domain protein [Leptomonas seymouri]|uniref:Putative Kelch-domain protein n=1 Tax=Leptomonas seymouri TaxID=5684 RepID=A0A0N0P7M2_LEPSE|nr:putative Kelch-domain protein [Leptomonas seymouri]|eukprot:KPI88936.1 putative Kelch-domain protein [Leptomonas seymouri]